jgi:hypothetical protein
MQTPPGERDIFEVNDFEHPFASQTRPDKRNDKNLPIVV